MYKHDLKLFHTQKGSFKSKCDKKEGFYTIAFESLLIPD